MKFSVQGLYHVGQSRFWETIFFQKDYNESLYLEGLSFHRFEVVSETLNAEGDRERTIQVFPKLDIPKVIERLVGPRVHYFEIGRFDFKTKRWHSEIQVPKLGGALKIQSTMWLEDQSPDLAMRHVDFEVDTQIPGLSRILGAFVQSVLTESYEQARLHSNRWFETRSSMTPRGRN